MSTTIENQVVSMEFDNKQFESNVRTSLSTIEKLKQSLKFHDAAKGLDNISSAASKVTLSPLSGAVDKVGLKFSALYTIADQTLRNIVNSVERTAKNIVSAFTIDPVKTGFQEYETQINAVQTILANTQSKGTTLDDVNEALDTLNTYADKTIYNFTEMTRNIGTFTAAGIDLETSVNAIQGIANLAAVSGSNAQQASTAMYQLSQALASGTVKLMDWNSVVNAGMGGQVFQDSLKETARVHGIAIDDMIEKQGSFRETLSEGWLTSEILTETLQKFTLTTEGLTEAQIEQNREMLKAKGYTDDQIDKIFELGKTATDAATKVKTFTQLMDTLKEAAQSGWTQTWELIIGDFEEAKNLWTSVSDVFGEIIGKSAENRNKVLAGALDNSGWDDLIDVVKDAKIEVSDFEEEVKKLAKENNIDIDSIIKQYGSLEAAIQACKIPVVLLQTAFESLLSKKSKSGFEEYTVQAGDTLEDLAKKWNTSVEEIMFLNNDLIKDSNEILTGWVIKIPKAIEETGEAAEEAGDHVENFYEALANVGRKGGRELLLESFKNIFGGIKKIIAGDDEKGFDGIADVWHDMFSISSDDLMGLITGFNEFSKVLIPTDETAQKITRTFRGLFSVLDILGYVLGGSVKIGFKVLTKILGSFDLNILDILAGAGDAIYNFSQNIEEGISSVAKFFKELYELPEVQAIVASLTDKVKELKEAFIARWDKGVDAFWEWIDRVKELDGFSLDNVKKALVDFRDNVLGEFLGVEDLGAVFDGWADSIQKFFKVVGSKSSETWSNIKDWVNSLKELDGISLSNIKTALVDFYKNVVKPLFVNEDGITIFNKLGESIKNCWISVKDWLGKLGVNLDSLIDKIVDFFKIKDFSIGDAWTNVIDKLSEIKDGIVGFITGIGDFLNENKGKIAGIASLIGIFLLIKKALDIGKTVADTIGVLGNIGEGFKSFTKSLSKSLKAAAIKSVAESIAILVGAIAVICYLPKDRLWEAVGVIGAVSGIIIVLFALSSLISNQMGTADLTKLAVSILSIAGALMVFALAAKILGGVEWESLGKAGAVLGAMVLFTVVLSKVAGDSRGLGNSMNGFGKMLLGLGVFLLMIAAAVTIFGNMETGTLVKGIAAVSIMLLELIGVMAATNLLAKVDKKSSIVKMGSIALGLGTALLMMAAAVAIFGNMDTGTLVKGAIAVGACIVALIGVMAATNLLAKTSNTGSIVKVGSLFASLGGALLMMSMAVAIFGNMDTKTLVKGGLAVGAFMGIMVGVMASTKLLATTGADKQFAKVSGTIMAFAGAILIISAAVAILGMMDYKDLLKSTIVIGGISIMLMGLIAVCHDVPAKATGTVLALAGTLLILAGSIIALTYVDADKLKLAAVALGGVIGVVALLAASLKGPAISFKNILGIAGALAAVLAVVSIFAAIGVASLPAIGKKMSAFMSELTVEGGFISGIERLSEVSAANPGVLESIGDMMSAMGSLASGAAKFAVTDWITRGRATESLTAMADWINEIIDIIIDLAPSLNGVTINHANLQSVIGAAKTLAECAALAPTVDVKVGGFGSKWGGGGGAIVSVPLLTAAKDWIVAVTPVVTDLATSVSAKGVTINQNNLEAVCKAASSLAEAAALAPSVTVAGGAFSSKWISGGGGVIDWPLLGAAEEWIIGVEPVISSLATLVSSGDAKNLDKTKLEAICNGAKTLAEAAASAPSVDLAVGFAKGPWGIGGVLGLSHPMISSAANWIIKVKDPIIDLATAVSGTTIPHFDADNLTAIVSAVKTLVEAADEAPTLDIGVVGGFSSLLKGGFIGGGISIPEIDEIATFIKDVKDPIINLANAASSGLDVKFNKENFETIISAIADISSIEFPTYIAGWGVGVTGIGIFGGGGVSAPQITEIADFVVDVKQPIIDLANAVANGIDVKFNKENFETIISAIADISSIEFPTFGAGGGLGITPIGLFGGGGVSAPQITEIADFIVDVKQPIIDLADAVSGGLGTDFSKSNFEAIVQAITDLASCEIPSVTALDGWLASLGGFGNFKFESKTDFEGFIQFISDVKQPISELATSVSAEDFNVDNDKLQSIVDAVNTLATAAKDIPTTSWVKETFTGVTEFKEFTSFIAEIGPAISTACSSLTDVTVDNEKLKMVTTAVKNLAEAAKYIPEEGGLKSIFTGDTAWDTFQENVGKFGSSISTFCENVGDIDLATTETASKAINNIAEGMYYLDQVVGLSYVADSVGFAMEKLGTSIVKFDAQVAKINVETLTSATTAFNMIADAMKNSLYGMDFESIDTSAFNTKVGDIADAMVSFNGKVAEVSSESISTAATTASQLVSMLSSIGLINYDGMQIGTFKDNLDAIADAMSSFAASTAECDPSSAVSKVNSLVKMLSSMSTANFTGANSFPETLKTLATTSISNFVSAFSSGATVDQVTAAGANLPTYVINGMASKIENVTTAGTAIADAAKSGVGSEDVLTGFETAGSNAAQGFIDGIDSKLEDATNAGTALGKAALDAAMAALDENSPSKEFYKVGAFGGIGLVNALSDYEGKTYNAGYDMAESAKNGLSDAISKVGGIIENGIDAQPTIRPVMDLSNVTAGAARINRMFGTPSVEVLSNVGTISAMMNGIQNGGNDDVISAINDLGKKLGNISGNTYNVNGITYDDGSNVSKAVETLVRAAERERRM